MTATQGLNKIKGNFGEDLACEYLLAHGFNVVARNYRCRIGEIDIIANKDEVLHFIEVKNRTADLIPGRFAVNALKQKRIRKTANHFLTEHNLFFKVVTSFDVIEITNGQIEYLENCFY